MILTMAKKTTMTYTQGARLILAGYMVAFLLLQLFAFEAFPGLLATVGLQGTWSSVVAIALVLVELLALPFLLGMKLPARALTVSKLCGGGALLGLTVLELYGWMAGVSVLFGATLMLPGGSWSLMLLLALWLLYIWGGWGERLVHNAKKGKK